MRVSDKTLDVTIVFFREFDVAGRSFEEIIAAGSRAYAMAPDLCADLRDAREELAERDKRIEKLEAREERLREASRIVVDDIHEVAWNPLDELEKILDKYDAEDEAMLKEDSDGE